MFAFLKKKPWRATVNKDGLTLEVAAGENLLAAALEAGIDWPHDCRAGSCGTCRGYLRQGKIKPLSDFTYTLEAEDIHAGAILACQTLLKSDIVVDVELGVAGDAIAIERHAGKIVRTHSLTHDIQSVTIATDEPCFQHAKAGQYAELSVAGIDQPRSYSFARPPRLENTGEVSFFIRHIPGGAFTDWLFSAQRSGENIEISGPYGNFHQREGDDPMICIAGGSGLAPIKALVEDGAEAGLQRDLVIYFGARTQSDLYCLEEIQTLGQQWGGAFQLTPVLSGEPPDSGWSGARGLVTDKLERLGDLGIVGDGCQGYLCGPPPMVDAGIAALQQLGLSAGRIFYDKFEDASTLPRSDT